ncbi:MAG: TetR/AcrR family transcriptional regulator [Nitrospirae bacterium]|nr:TetR/AcrR family transcriptional regulator [Nitrospirota bacterium]
MSTKEKILKTAIKLFSKKGYLGATTKEIAKEAGIAEVTLFRYFPSKENLFEETLSVYSFLPVLKGLLPDLANMPFDKALKIIAHEFLNTLESKKYLIRIMHSEVSNYPDKVHKIYHNFIEEMIKTLASFFEEQQKKGILREFNTNSGAMAFLGMFFSFFNARELHMMKNFKNLDVKKIVEDFIDIFIRGSIK